MVLGLNYKTAQIKLRDANLNIRVLATRYDLAVEPVTIIAQTPQAGERVDCGTVIGVTMSAEEPAKSLSPQNCSKALGDRNIAR
jgi:beta-lactam-binding protein with PASTA domain